MRVALSGEGRGSLMKQQMAVRWLERYVGIELELAERATVAPRSARCTGGSRAR